MELEEHPVSGLTDDQRVNNFAKIMTTNQYLDDGGAITDEWMAEHKQLILQYREWISDYSIVNDEIEEISFRKCCSETEILLSQLCHSIWSSGTFNVKIYHIFMRRMKQILDTIYTEDELSELLGGLSM